MMHSTKMKKIVGVLLVLILSLPLALDLPSLFKRESVNAHALSAEKFAEVSLVSDKSEVNKGGAFYVGVVFKLQPGWHIYGKESKGAGLPTRIRFTLPNGFKDSELIWPEEKPFDLPGDVKASGYEGQVVIAKELLVPSFVKSGETITITADIDWLLCSDKVCVPSKASKVIEIPIGADKSSPMKDLFKELYL